MKFNSVQLSFETFFDIIGNFSAFRPDWSEPVFPIWCIIIFSKIANLWSPLAPLLGKIEICVHWLFYIKFNSKQLLFGIFFDIIGNFCRIQPWNESIFTFWCITILSKMASLWNPPASPLQEREKYAYWLFCRKFYSGHFLSAKFVDISGIFCSVQIIDYF